MLNVIILIGNYLIRPGKQIFQDIRWKLSQYCFLHILEDMKCVLAIPSHTGEIIIKKNMAAQLSLHLYSINSSAA